jgi:hippurate hydrolase
MKIRSEIEAIKDEIAGYRRAMHENPQTAYEETFASDLVADKLSAWGIKHERASYRVAGGYGCAGYH